MAESKASPFLAGSATLEEAFKKLDRNGDGVISAREIRKYFKEVLKVKLSKKEVEEMISLADLDGDRKLDFKEFSKIAQTPPPDNFADLRNAFSAFDTNHDNFVDAKELLSAMRKMPGSEKITEEEVSAMIREADIDGDEKINFVEFVALVKKLSGK